MTDLYTVDALFRMGAKWQMVFTSEEKAQEVYAVLTSAGAVADVADDFGLRWHLKPEDLVCVQFGDVAKVQEGQGEQALALARAQSKTQTLAAADPMIRKGVIISPPTARGDH